jgi:hypothetical protein
MIPESSVTFDRNEPKLALEITLPDFKIPTQGASFQGRNFLAFNVRFEGTRRCGPHQLGRS